MPTIEDFYASIPGTKLDYKIEWKEDASEDWKIDWDTVAGDLPGEAPSFSAPAVISGDAIVGQTLTVSTGTWLGNPTPVITYQWISDAVVAPGATTNQYILGPGEVGRLVWCDVTATNSEGFAVSTATEVGPVIAGA